MDEGLVTRRFVLFGCSSNSGFGLQRLDRGKLKWFWLTNQRGEKMLPLNEKHALFRD